MVSCVSFQKQSFLCSHKHLYELWFLYQWCIIHGCFDSTYLRDSYVFALTKATDGLPVVRPKATCQSLPYPRASRAGTLLGFLLPPQLFCWLLQASLTSERHTTGRILELFSAYTHTLDDLIRAWYHPYSDNSRFYISSPSHALNPRFLIRLPLELPSDVWPMTQTETVQNGTPDLSSYLFTSCRLPPFNSIFFPSFSDLKPQTSMSSFLLSNPISHPLANPIDSSFKQYLTSSHRLRCYLGLSHHQSLPRLLQ